MKIIPTQYVAGCPVGQVTSVDDEFGGWLIANGYAVEPAIRPSNDAGVSTSAATSTATATPDTATSEDNGPTVAVQRDQGPAEAPAQPSSSKSSAKRSRKRSSPSS